MTDNASAIDVLESRLERGWKLIDQAERESNARAVSRYTRRWLQLLEEYEDLMKTGAPEQSLSSDE